MLHNNVMHTSVESITDDLALARHRYDGRYHDHPVDEKIADGGVHQVHWFSWRSWDEEEGTEVYKNLLV